MSDTSSLPQNLPDTVFNIHGYLSGAEGKLLYDLACTVPMDGVIVEIGSFQGRSTAALGLGAKRAGAFVWAIDPHAEHQENSETRYGMHNHALLLKYLLEFELAEVVRVVAFNSHHLSWANLPRIDLLWIDGSHLYEDVKLDFMLWTPWLNVGAKIAVHDASGLFADVTRALNEFLADGKWMITQQVDATVVLERVNR